MQLRSIRPGKPIQNAFVGSFIGRLRYEFLNQHWFGSLAEAARVIEIWRQHNNRERPHRCARLPTAGAVRALARPLDSTKIRAARRRSPRRQARATTSMAHLRHGPNFGVRPFTTATPETTSATSSILALMQTIQWPLRGEDCQATRG